MEDSNILNFSEFESTLDIKDKEFEEFDDKFIACIENDEHIDAEQSFNKEECTDEDDYEECIDEDDYEECTDEDEYEECIDEDDYEECTDEDAYTGIDEDIDIDIDDEYTGIDIDDDEYEDTGDDLFSGGCLDNIDPVECINTQNCDTCKYNLQCDLVVTAENAIRVYKGRQRRVYENKLKHGFNVVDFHKEARFILKEVSELMSAIEHNDTKNIMEELADIVIFCYGIAEMAHGNLDAQIFNKMSINESRQYIKDENGDFIRMD